MSHKQQRKSQNQSKDNLKQWSINQDILKMIVDKAQIQPTDIVLEIGPRQGILTQLLINKAQKVICLEQDPRMCAELNKKFKYSDQSQKFQLIEGDIIQQQQLPNFDIVIGYNDLQYQAIFKLLQFNFRNAIFMLQKDIAMRLVSKPGNDLYCRLSANIQLLSQVTHLSKVDKKFIHPSPKIDYSIILIQPKINQTLNFQEWDSLLNILFMRKNKQLGAIFKNKKLIKQIEQKNIEFQKQKTLAIDQINNKNYIFMNTNNEQMEDEKDEMENNDDIEEENFKDNSFKLKINEILENIEFKQKRINQLDIDEFSKLLNIFNQNDIHFI